MVSFQCDACCDVVKKPKLDTHRARCGASFTCIDCSTTFAGPHQYKSHTSCISEAQKYEKGLYKGNKNGQAGNGGNPNGNAQWPRGRFGQNNQYRNGRYQQPRGTGPNDIPLGATAKMTFTPPNEEVTDKQVEQDAKPSGAAVSSGPVTTTETPKAAEGQEQVQPVKAKKGKPRKPKEPPPPGETRAERKQRKKKEKAERKKEKLFKRAQQKALVAEEKRKKALEQEKAYLDANKVTTRSAANATVLSDQVNGTSHPPQAQSDSVVERITSTTEYLSKEKQSKKRKHADMDQENIQPTQGDVDMQDGTQKDKGHEEEKVKKKKKKSKEEKAAVDSEGHHLPNGHSTGDVDPLEQSKPSKKRKREANDEEGKELIDGVEKMSFKERCRAEKKARKAEKAAKKAKMMQTLEELNSQTP